MIIIEAKENYVDIMLNMHVNCLQYGLFRKGHIRNLKHILLTYIAIHTVCNIHIHTCIGIKIEKCFHSNSIVINV